MHSGRDFRERGDWAGTTGRFTSENTPPVAAPRRRGRAPVALPVRLEGRARRLHRGTIPRILSSETRRAYASKVRGYLAWLADATADGLIDGDPLAAPTPETGPCVTTAPRGPGPPTRRPLTQLVCLW